MTHMEHTQITLQIIYLKRVS